MHVYKYSTHAITVYVYTYTNFQGMHFYGQSKFSGLIFEDHLLSTLELLMFKFRGLKITSLKKLHVYANYKYKL